MPKLTKATEALRVTQAMQALSLMTNGMSKAEACEEAGISIGQYHRWVGKGEEAIKAIRDTAIELQRRQLVDILTAQEEATHMLIDEMLSDETDPQVRLKLFMYLDKKLEQLAIEHHAAGQTEDDALAYLQGPVLRKGKSRFRSSTVNIHPQNDGSVDVTTYQSADIVDAEFADGE